MVIGTLLIAVSMALAVCLDRHPELAGWAWSRLPVQASIRMYRMSTKSQRSWRHVPFPVGDDGDAPRPEGSIWERFLRCQEKVTAMATFRALRLDAGGHCAIYKACILSAVDF